VTERDEALEKIKAMLPNPNSLAAYIRKLALGGFFDAPVNSRDTVRAISDRFGRRFPPGYLPVYMKPFLELGALRAEQFPGTRGKLWFGAWLTDGAGFLRTAEPLRFKLDTTGWHAEVAEDFELGVACYTGKLWKPAAVMIRRAYEGALIQRYRATEGREPEKEGTCPKCRSQFGKRPLSISDLHFWAVRQSLVREKMDGVSALLKDLGAGGAHPTKGAVIDAETSEIIIKCGRVLLSDLYRRKLDSA
jgi:hypothetical protein